MVELSKKQLDIVSADPNAKLLVDAGPGTGKTEVACARTAWLIQEHDVRPHQILFVSFTRAAIKESRKRIQKYLDGANAALSVRMSTLDSLAGQLLSAFGDPKTNSFRSYDENIESLLELISQDEPLREYLSDFRHIFVDEGQDTYSVRSNLVQELIWIIASNGGGATVFFDQAQSIYGWAESEDAYEGGDQEQLNLPTTLQLMATGEFEVKYLDQIHRSSDRNLLAMYEAGREILVSDDSGSLKLEKITALVKEKSKDTPKIDQQIIELAKQVSNDTFFLFLRRGEVLQASSYMNGNPHRLILRDQPPQIFPWLASAFWDWTSEAISKTEFIDLFNKRELSSLTTFTSNECWDLLFEYSEHDSRRNSIDLDLLTRRLGANPPLEFVSPTMGSKGPIFSTVYSAKGLEASQVNFYIHKNSIADGQDSSLARAARVLFVGASRAKESLSIGPSAYIGGELKSGRAMLRNFQKEVRIHVGRTGDLTAQGLVGRDSFSTEEAALSAQARIAEYPLQSEELISQPREDRNLVHELLEKKTMFKLGEFSEQLGWDLRYIPNSTWRRYSRQLWYLRVLGLHSIVVPPVESERSKLHYPWNQSGFVLAPTLVGFPTVRSRKRNA